MLLRVLLRLSFPLCSNLVERNCSAAACRALRSKLKKKKKREKKRKLKKRKIQVDRISLIFSCWVLNDKNSAVEKKSKWLCLGTSKRLVTHE